MYEFGPFRFDGTTRSLYRGAEFVPLTPKAAEILLLLLQEAGRVVTKELILEKVWPGVVVEEGTITNNVSALRKTIDTGDFGTDGPIATVPRRGYRFTATVIPAKAGIQSSTQPVTPSQDGAQSPRRDTVLVGDIENKTGDAIFDGTIRQALLLLLAQSPYLEVLSDHKVLSVLGYMGKRDAPLTGDVALEVAQRTGSRALITGSIFAFGDEYMIGLQALQGDSGSIAISEQARARGKGEVLKALDAAAIGLRTKLGESLASVRQFARDFDEVATSSLEALKAYAMGRNQWVTNGDSAAKPHFLRAIERDAEFASAYSALAHVCSNMGQAEEGMRHMRRAYELRDRATERERARIEASYHYVTGDLFKAIDAQRAWHESSPRDPVASGNMGDMLMMVGQWDKALAAFQHSHALEANAMSASNLAIAAMALGRHEEARAVLDDAFARGHDVFYLHLDAYQEAFLRGDTASTRRHADAAMGKPTEEDFLLAAQADTEACHGRFTRARELSRRAIQSARDAGTIEMAAMWEGLAALREAEIGETDRALAGARAALETFTGRDTQCIAGLVFARCGASSDAEHLAAELDAGYPQGTLVQRYWLPCIRAAIAIARRDWKAALDALEPAHAVEFALNKPFEGGFMIPTYLRGIAWLGAGRGEEAAAELMKIVERPGLIKNFVLFALAQRHASTAFAAAGRPDDARAMRARFDEAWASADVEAPPA